MCISKNTCQNTIKLYSGSDKIKIFFSSLISQKVKRFSNLDKMFYSNNSSKDLGSWYFFLSLHGTISSLFDSSWLDSTIPPHRCGEREWRSQAKCSFLNSMTWEFNSHSCDKINLMIISGYQRIWTMFFLPRCLCIC